MTVSFRSDGKGIEIQFKANWRSVRAAIKALLSITAAVVSLLAAPQIVRFDTVLGWW
jgi:hypothetical protein